MVQLGLRLFDTNANPTRSAVDKGKVGTHQWDIDASQILSLDLLIVKNTSSQHLFAADHV